VKEAGIKPVTSFTSFASLPYKNWVFNSATL